MVIRLMRVDSDGRPDVGIALGDRDDVSPLALAGRDVEKALDAPLPGAVEHFLLALGEAGVIEVAMAVDQPHFAASGCSSSSRRGNSGCGCAIGTPPSPASITAMSFSADAGITGRTASASLRTAATKVPSTAAIRSGSVLRSAHGAMEST